ncbi:MAG: hypothetical protein JWP87_2413, partial [Labilithrix sp.]|nr:hypothetical protein [Labilithrix sp.]
AIAFSKFEFLFLFLFLSPVLFFSL